MNKRSVFLAVAILFQTMALAGIVWQREEVLRTGETVFIRTTPLDPRDIFRGDYVRLRYPVSDIPMKQVPFAERDGIRQNETRVYLTYQTDARGVLDPVSLTLKKPSKGRWIRGFTQNAWQTESVGVRYGIEKFFVQQGTGRPMEEGWRLEGVQIPLEMEAAIGKENGIAVLKGYRYAEMGIGLVFPNRGASNSNDTPFQVTVKIANATDHPKTIVNPANHASFQLEFRLQYDVGNKKSLSLKTPIPLPERYSVEDAHVIAPHSIHSFEMDFSKPEYQLTRGGKDASWNELDWSEQVRLVYHSPDSRQVEGLPDTTSLWQGTLSSRFFNRHQMLD